MIEKLIKEYLSVSFIFSYLFFWFIVNILVVADFDILHNEVTYYKNHFSFIKIEIILFVFLVFFLILSFLSYNHFRHQIEKLSAVNDKLFQYLEFGLYFIIFIMLFKYLLIGSFIFKDYFSIHFFFNYLCIFDFSIVITKLITLFLFLFLNYFLKLQHSIFRDVNRFLVFEKHFLLISMLFFLFFLLNSSDFNVIFICFEAITFILSLMIAFNYNKISIEAAIKYFSLSAVASSFLVLGSALIYGSIFVTDYFHIKLFLYSYKFEILPDYIFVGCFFIILSFLFKLSLYPGNLWVADVYSGCSIGLLFFISVILKIIIFLVFLKILFFVFFYLYFYWRLILIISSIGSIFFSAFGLITATTLKTFIAYSSVGQFGFLIFSTAYATSNFGFQVIFSYLLFYIVVNCLLFLIIANLIYSNLFGIKINEQINDFNKTKENSNTFEKVTDKFSKYLDLSGYISLYKRKLLSSILLTVCLLSLAGFPPFLGFFVKYQLFILITSQNFSFFLIFFIISLNFIIAFGYFRWISNIWTTTNQTFFFEENVFFYFNLADSKYYTFEIYNDGEIFVKNNNKILIWLKIFLVQIQIFGFYFIDKLNFLSYLWFFYFYNFESFFYKHASISFFPYSHFY